jgi:DNA-directed RNA polymerase specialized sigma24 family protein
LQLADSSDETLRNLYRLAVLLTGDPGRAETVLLATVAHSSAHLAQYRDRRHGLLYFVKLLRQGCRNTVPPGDPDPKSFADCFARLPEPSRSALALFYINLLTIEEVAEVLDMDLMELGDTLGAARGLLFKSDAAL